MVSAYVDKVRIVLSDGRALVCCVDALAVPPHWEDCLEDAREVSWAIDRGHGLWVRHPNPTFLPHHAIVSLEAVVPTAEVGIEAWPEPEREPEPLPLRPVSRPVAYDLSGEIPRIA